MSAMTEMSENERLPTVREAAARLGQGESTIRRKTRTDEMAAGGRRIRVVAGEGLVTPTRRMEVVYEGRREVLEPGRSRLAPDHPLVRRCGPERFQLACRDDRTDAPLIFRRMLERARRELEAQRAQLDGRRLPAYEPTGAEPWRL